MVMNLTRIYEDAGLIPGLDLAWQWLWLWHRLAAAASIRPLAWELPYVLDTALKKTKKKKEIPIVAWW